MSATKQYLTTQPCYRGGIYHQAGTVLTVPEDEKPSRTWRLVDAPKEEKSASKGEPKPKEEKSASKGRASDSSGS